MFKKLAMMLLAIVLILNVSAQDAEMADGFRGEGKIYVVVAVMLLLLIGLFVYLFRIERRVKKLENE